MLPLLNFDSQPMNGVGSKPLLLTIPLDSQLLYAPLTRCWPAFTRGQWFLTVGIFKGKETAVVPVLPSLEFCCEGFRAYADPEVWTACFLHA